MRTLPLLLTALAASLAPSGRAAPVAASRPPTVTWSFATHTDPDLTPHSRVFLRVNGKRIPVYETTATFQTLRRRDYKDHGVPSSAVAACSGWFAGQGDDLYVVRHGGRLVVFMRELDEQADTTPYKWLKSIPVD